MPECLVAEAAAMCIEGRASAAHDSRPADTDAAVRACSDPLRTSGYTTVPPRIKCEAGSSGHYNPEEPAPVWSWAGGVRLSAQGWHNPGVSPHDHANRTAPATARGWIPVNTHGTPGVLRTPGYTTGPLQGPTPAIRLPARESIPTPTGSRLSARGSGQYSHRMAQCRH
jgi:hypothetical protein